jgi:hypothetical protein
MRRALALFFATSIACGAKSGLEMPPARDAGMIDAGRTLDTLPCRWSAGPELVLERELDDIDLDGAVDADFDVAMIGVRQGAFLTASSVTLSQSPSRLESYTVSEGGRVFSAPNGFVRQTGDECALIVTNRSFVELDRIRFGDGRCALTQSRIDSVESYPLAGGDVTRVALDMFRPAAEIVRRADTIADEAVFIRADDGDYFATVRGGAITLARDETIVWSGEGARVTGAVDRLRGGAIFLYRAPSGWQLTWVHDDRAEPIADLSALPAEPIGRLASNETEVLFPLADGSIAYVPLSRTLIRYVDPVADGVESMELMLRPGSSAGAVAYYRERVLAYRALVCNR